MSVTLTTDEIYELTRYKRPSDQLAELHRQGFHRARRSQVTGDIILERAHFDAVCSGAVRQVGPKLRTPTLKHA